MNLKNHKVYKALKNKVENDGRMPSIVSIHNLLTDLGIEHYFDEETVNVVEYRSAGNTYVNDRHDGKVGKQIKFRAYANKISESPFMDFGEKSKSQWFDLDSSESYYSWNTYRYACDLLAVLNNYKKMTFTQD